MEKFIDIGVGLSDTSYARLSYDNWDDYHYKTTVRVEIVASDGTVSDIGSARFAYLGQEPGSKSWDRLPDRSSGLGEEWVSLGLEPEYYDLVGQIEESLRSRYLTAVRDAAWEESIEARFAKQDVWQISLLRFPQAAEALRIGRELRSPAVTRNPWRESHESIRVRLENELSQSQTEFDFTFAPAQGLPSPLAALIGYNGTGKTTALAQMALLAHADSSERAKDGTRLGEFIGEVPPPVSSVIMVSYSAFDTFKLPNERAQEQNSAAGEGELIDYFGYSYCGLRATSSPGRFRLKSSTELEEETRKNAVRALRANRVHLLNAALQEFEREPSMIEAGLTGDIHSILEKYPQLSSGHKIATSIILHLSAWLNTRSLVLIDEPETHLHPSLLSALVRTIRALVESVDARAIIATHSPVVLQELPSSSVQVVSRAFGITSVRKPDVETFAESLESISSYVFRLDASQSDYRATLRDLASRHSAEEISRMFPRGLPGRALSYVLERQRAER